MSVRQRKDRPGRWVIDYTSNGRRVQVATDQDGNPLTTRKAAESYYRRILAEQHGGTHVPRPGATRLAQLPELYLAAERRRAAQGRLSPAVVENKRRDLLKVLKHLEGDLPLPELRPRHVTADLAPALLDEGYSHKTVREVVNTLRHAIEWAHHNELVPLNRLAGVALDDPRERLDLGDMLEPGLVSRVLDKAPRHGLALRLMAYTGLRSGEVRALVWSAVDFDRDVIRVLRAVKPGVGIGPTKTGAGKREVPVLPELRAALLERWLSLPLPRSTEALVFPPTKDGRFADAGAWLEALHVGCRLVGVTPLRNHDLRHFYASLLIREGFEPWRICQLMGHSSIAVTERVYRHWLRDDERNRSDAAKLQAAMRRARGNNTA